MKQAIFSVIQDVTMWPPEKRELYEKYYGAAEVASIWKEQCQFYIKSDFTYFFLYNNNILIELLALVQWNELPEVAFRVAKSSPSSRSLS